MEKINFIKKICAVYKYDIFAFLALLAVFICLVPIFIYKVQNPLIDCFETGVYIPWLILKGKVLYKDMYILYGPLSCQINALFLWLFGLKISSVYIAGIANSLLIITALYLIARTVASQATAFIIAFLVSVTCVFHFYIFNFIFPYAPASTYGLSSLLLALLFSLYYIKTSNARFMMLLSLFAGICLSIKLDFAVSLAVMILITLLLKPLSGKYLLLSIMSFMLVPVLSWSVLFIQGLRLSDISNFLEYCVKFSTTTSSKEFYTQYSSPIPSLDVLRLNFTWFLKTSGYFIPILIIYPVLFLVESRINKRIVQLSVIGILTLVLVLLHKNFEIHYASFSWAGITTTLILLIMLAPLIIPRKLSFRDRFLTLDFRRKALIFIAITGILASIRSLFCINLHMFGTFLLPLLLLVNIVYLIEYIPDYFKFLDKNIWKCSCIVILTVIGISTSINHIKIVNDTYPIKSKSGTIYAVSDIANAFNQVIQYIEQNFPANARFVIMPKGVALNFLTQRFSDNQYFDLIPPIVETQGEDKMIEDLSKNPPDYILLNNKDNSDWGYSLFGVDYAKKMNDFVIKNYKFEKVFGNKKFWIAVFKKSKNEFG